MQPLCYSYIRFSTPEQIKGDSLRRQTKAAEKWAQDNGYVLDDSLNLRDLGISGFSGKHRKEGALAKFLQLIKEGQIVPGSILLVENLDRISREQPFDAHQLFFSILEAGIKIVTLDNEKEWTREIINSDIAAAILFHLEANRAHGESDRKSKLIREAWKGKRQRIGKKKLTARAPDWLELSEDKTKFTAIPERAEVINRIFRLKLEGVGSQSIVKKLNAEEQKKREQNLPYWLPKPMRANSLGGWRKSYIEKIIRNKAVVGEFQPHLTSEGKRTPDGSPIQDYFPRVVSDELFYGLKDQLSRNQHKGGRTGKISNLFGHIAKCGYCGAPMQFISKGNGPKGGQYLVCDSARRGRGCDYHSVRYHDFESIVLKYCQGLDVSDILPNAEEGQAEVQGLRNKLAGIKGQLSEIESKINNLTDSIATTADKRIRDRLEANLSALLDDQEKFQNDEKSLQRDIKLLSRSVKTIQAQIDSVKKLLSLFGSKEGEQMIELRLRLKNRIRNLISKINVYAVGVHKAVMQRIVQHESPGMAKKIKSKLENGGYDKKNSCAFTVHFATGNWQKLTPYSSFEVESEFDSAKGKTVSIGFGANGEPTVDVDYKNR